MGTQQLGHWGATERCTQGGVWSADTAGPRSLGLASQDGPGWVRAGDLTPQAQEGETLQGTSQSGKTPRAVRAPERGLRCAGLKSNRQPPSSVPFLLIMQIPQPSLSKADWKRDRIR